MQEEGGVYPVQGPRREEEDEGVRGLLRGLSDAAVVVVQWRGMER